MHGWRPDTVRTPTPQAIGPIGPDSSLVLDWPSMADAKPVKPAKYDKSATRHRGPRDRAKEAERHQLAQAKAVGMVNGLRSIEPVRAILPIWKDAAADIASLRRTEMEAGRYGTLADESLIAGILQAIDGGLTTGQAAQAFALHPKTIQDHVEQGERDIEGQLVTARAAFAYAAKMARERLRLRLLGRIEDASSVGPQYWTAAAWILERGYGTDYKLQINQGSGQVVVNVGVIGATDVRIGGESVSIPGSDTKALPTVDVVTIPASD